MEFGGRRNGQPPFTRTAADVFFIILRLSQYVKYVFQSLSGKRPYNKMKSLLQQNAAKASLQAFQSREAEDICPPLASIIRYPPPKETGSILARLYFIFYSQGTITALSPPQKFSFPAGPVHTGRFLFCPAVPSHTGKNPFWHNR